MGSHTAIQYNAFSHGLLAHPGFASLFPLLLCPVQSVEAFEHDWAYSSTMAEKDFGYSPLPLAQGLRETLEWLKGHNIISY